MKTIIFTFCIIFSLLGIAQTPTEKAEGLAKQFVAKNQHLYHDMKIRNAGNTPVAVIGIDMLNSSYYYTEYSYYMPIFTYPALRMIHFETKKANYTFTRSFIYDEFQNLRYYMYTSNCDTDDKMLEFLISFNNGVSQIITQNNLELAAENRFAYSENMFKDSVIQAESETWLNSLERDGFTFNYSKQTKFIKNEYARINSGNLSTITQDSITGQYMNDTLVKITVDGYRPREYYLSNGLLIFTFYENYHDMEAIRIYYRHGNPYRYQRGTTLTDITVPDDFAFLAEKIFNDFKQVKVLLKK